MKLKLASGQTFDTEHPISPKEVFNITRADIDAMIEQIKKDCKPPQGLVLLSIMKMRSELNKIGIAKKEENKDQKYFFRGIDAIRNAVAALQDECQLLIIPSVTARVQHEYTTKNGGRAVQVIVEMDFHFINTVDGSTMIFQTVNEAIDYSDKATNKAISMCFKTMCINAFNIPTEGEEDTDEDKDKGKDLQGGSNSTYSHSKPSLKIEPVILPSGQPDYDEFAAEMEIKIPMMQTPQDVSLLNRSNAKVLRDMERDRPELFANIGELFRKQSDKVK